MSDARPPGAILVAAVGVLLAAACAIQLRGGEGSSSPATAEETTSLDGSDVASCRSVTTNDTMGYQHCLRIWAENRRRFFGDKNGPLDFDPGKLAGSSGAAPKDQSRLSQGYPPVTIPDASRR
ncbi:putative entry exclusion protein TrbK-alt [Bradyrhizobium japonicum]|uniref:putative entry exclusion protein TrbK-alt n=1 Tax=Bradyrhizobium japonicum TaxID=375 RepID=UPI001E538239|nr:putative entry exclusion protein TrbK-alt [Bradyrhizobium japonicum]MCD9821356.1 putative entry exclusion protein TrbK-alt [Bradyrhizobium japonicum]MCD9895634.1 putative entry exclusion protein TrbK-alt [Bradyrhizobium japonicum]MEB2673245.1 putative entry exclusion protein TrbK-alt [Bradyrhizobium japonicum]WLB31823.1 putative entry exclusion protein TrbK-alt [Bradyrhizobium japonicum]WRI92467.1 putative entry exclusion protein TrbK-alt [Bradyrhizobium japonicum]